MSTTPTPAPTQSNAATILSLIEGFGNLALVGLQSGGVAPPGSLQIATLLETSINTLVAGQTSGTSSADQEILNAYAVLIAGFKAYQIASGSNTALVAKIGEYLAATEAALAGFAAAGAGYNPANYPAQIPLVS